MSEPRPSTLPLPSISERPFDDGNDLASQNQNRYHNGLRQPPMDTQDHSILLTPPANEQVMDPFASILNSASSTNRSSDTGHAGHEDQNVNARLQNAANFASLASSSPGHGASGLRGGLQIRTDFRRQASGSFGAADTEGRLRTSSSAHSLPHRVPSIRSLLHSAAGSLSPGPVITSPQIAAMLDITPLPSPTMVPSGSWKALARTRSRGSSTSSRADLPSAAFLSLASTSTSPRKKTYPGLVQNYERWSTSDDQGTQDERARTRSISDYVPEALAVPKQPRPIAISGNYVESPTTTTPMHREDYLGIQRGIITPIDPGIGTTTSFADALSNENQQAGLTRVRGEIFQAHTLGRGIPRRYEALRVLGQGTFSKVHLAVRLSEQDIGDNMDYRKESTDMAGVRARSRRLVAVKVIEPGPAGGADAGRIEIGLQREVELMKKVQHPSIIHLKAFGRDTAGRALLVMNYCPGGDLFELASTHLDLLTTSLVQRIFAELVSAVKFLHQKYIVHRDIKLENVLLNVPVNVLPDVSGWQKLDRAVITLTDLGLSREVPQPPESPLLETRCGSEDYAAPELIMGQPYDGRQTDAWALGVLLYSLMEGRLPFDPVPGARGDPAVPKARTTHRIARCEWVWVKYGDDDDNGVDDKNWDPVKGKEFEGARKCVTDLLKRNTRRTPLADIREREWVRGGITCDGGLMWVEEEIN